ncbi:ABC transporter substrate-binding protein [Ferdinandcohnia quinoae]|uniref:ABC transporter substrate-binding protein n=1 Tax=Fredinandcohnia quinoae TaxID=2918902 RepID=A0AAW5E0Q9_9BACI|nr:ABC transporter substrate-binding protein [Fredinandcohnia sp. SECRCQ15]MCH1625903.1 ABC transporter substrate-binding protein [Fredinandcohnia sp. SECRCQ15]
MSIFRNKFITTLLMVGSILLLITGCGNDEANTKKESKSENTQTDQPKESEKEEEQTDSGPIVVTDLAGNKVELEKMPERVIAFSSGDLYTILELGGEVVGKPTIRGEENNEKLKDIPEIGEAISINIEKIAELKPDLVIAHKQLNAKDIPQLKQLGIEVLLTGAQSIDESIHTIEMIGKVIDKNKEAEKLINSINHNVEEYKASNNGDVRSLIIFGVPGNWMVALPNSLSGSFLEAVGGYNIAKDYPKLEKFPQYAQVNIERIVEANPDVIFLITPGSEEAARVSFTKEMEKNPTWKTIKAVQEDQFIILPNHLFGSNPGPRVIESLEYLRGEIQKVSAK